MARLGQDAGPDRVDSARYSGMSTNFQAFFA